MLFVRWRGGGDEEDRTPDLRIANANLQGKHMILHMRDKIRSFSPPIDCLLRLSAYHLLPISY